MNARFNHIDFEYENWYERELELSQDDEGNPIDFNCDTVYARTKLGESVIDWINDELSSNFKFESMYFPKEYNFERDAINASFSIEDYEKLSIWVRSSTDIQKELIEKVEAYGTSSSGYIAFHSVQGIWGNKGLLVGIILEIFCEKGESDFSDYFDRKCIFDSLYKEAE